MNFLPLGKRQGKLFRIKMAPEAQRLQIWRILQGKFTLTSGNRICWMKRVTIRFHQ